jgi:hypothetical protein
MKPTVESVENLWEMVWPIILVLGRK